jgi:SPP1 family predicted phage head-tail adaptor
MGLLKSGELQHQCKLQASTRVQGTDKNIVYEWHTVDADVWVKLEPLQIGGRANTMYYAQQIIPNVTTRVTMRYRVDVHEGMRLVEETPTGKVAYVFRQEPYDPTKEYVVLECLSQQVNI